MSKIVILLTACINPPIQTPYVAVKDFKLRENQYFEAVKFYVSFGYDIVFTESSNTKSEKILNITKDLTNFEYHTFYSNNSIHGKGAGEADIFKFAF